MKKIYITRPVPGSADSLLRSAGFEVKSNLENRPLSKSELLEALKADKYDGVLSLLHDSIDAEVFDAAPSVKIFSNYAVGFNNIDVEEAKKRGITITNTPSNFVNESVAEHTFAMILALACRVVEGDMFVRAGKYTGWDPNLLNGLDLKGKTIGVIGAGRIGTYVIEKAVKGFGMKAIYYDIVRNEAVEKNCGAECAHSIEDVFKKADVITLHVLLTDKTRHLVSREMLEIMKSSAFIVNTSRGPVIDEKALVEALREGRIRGAGLDVFEDEPKISPELLAMQNVVLTPHIASATEATREEMTRIAVKNLTDFFSGKKPEFAVK